MYGAPAGPPHGGGGGQAHGLHIVTRSISVPIACVGYVLGRRGRTIRDIAVTTGTDVHIDDSVAGSSVVGGLWAGAQR